MPCPKDRGAATIKAATLQIQIELFAMIGTSFTDSTRLAIARAVGRIEATFFQALHSTFG
jgi:hypothetical protein